MLIDEQKHDDIDIIILSGRFVMEYAQESKSLIIDNINKGRGKLLINMEKITFMDSSGLAVLIQVYKELQLKSGRLILVTNPVVQSLLELTRMHTIFEILPNQNNALATLCEKL